MTRTISRLAAVLVAGLIINAPVFAKDTKDAKEAKVAKSTTTVATVNGVAIPKSFADALMAEQATQGTPDNAEVRAMVREELVRREVMTQEAKKKGFDKKPEVIGQIELARQALLIRAYLQDYAKQHPISDEAVAKEYETLTKAMGDKEYKARHILVKTEQEAKDIVVALQKGGKFEDLAKQSIDPGSKDRGGDLGWANPAGYVKPFAEALVKLEKGKFSAEPVKSEFGYHVIMLEDTREMKHPPLAEVRPQIQTRLQQQMIEKLALELRGKAKVE